VNIKQRQAEGIKLAKEQGKKLGRPEIEYPPAFEDTYSSWKRGEITAVKAMELLSLKKSTFYKFVKVKEGT
jgi:DNA invertase Pin-like site-specific DNA recombinase